MLDLTINKPGKQNGTMTMSRARGKSADDFNLYTNSIFEIYYCIFYFVIIWSKKPYLPLPVPGLSGKNVKFFLNVKDAENFRGDFGALWISTFFRYVGKTNITGHVMLRIQIENWEADLYAYEMWYQIRK